MKLCNIRIKLSQFLSKEKRIRIIAVIGLLGIFLIMLSEIVPSENNNSETPSENLQTASDETEQYKKQIEQELTELLSQISGVGKCNVMVTVEGTTEYVYAENLSKYTDENGTSVSDKYENDIVMIEKDGEKQALVKKIIKPQINGVVVVCEGGGDVKINERVLKTVSTALGISSSKICVESKIR